MKFTLHNSAFTCHLMSCALLCFFGLLYLFRSEFMPYHAVAIELEWHELDTNMQVLLLALMKACAGGFIATLLGCLFILFIPFRKKELWSYWAIASIGFVISAILLYVTLFVASNTPANPPWYAAATGMLLSLTGLRLSLTDKNRKA